jgi:hypothetical protein
MSDDGGAPGRFLHRADGILGKLFGPCSKDPKGSVFRGWIIAVVLILIYFVLSIVESACELMEFISYSLTLKCVLFLLFSHVDSGQPVPGGRRLKGAGGGNILGGYHAFGPGHCRDVYPQEVSHVVRDWLSARTARPFHPPESHFVCRIWEQHPREYPNESSFGRIWVYAVLGALHLFYPPVSLQNVRRRGPHRRQRIGTERPPAVTTFHYISSSCFNNSIQGQSIHLFYDQILRMLDMIPESW